ncbi:NEMP1 protein, partial [Amia calva]|nr:NEMP1 protein [Amia calva]
MDIPLVDQEVCFKVKPVKPRVSYSVHVTGKKLNILLFAMFLCGLSLFYFAGRICRQMWRLCGGLFNLFRRKKPAHRYLTEEEYRWQGEIHTRASLDALRQHCRTPGFPAWDTVLRLRAPQRFAGFLQGSSHITPTESQAHDRQYGVGGLFYEEIIYPAGGGTVPALEWNSSQRPSEDFSEDELEYYEPIQSPLALTPPVLAPAPAPAVLQTEDLELF